MSMLRLTVLVAMLVCILAVPRKGTLADSRALVASELQQAVAPFENIRIAGTLVVTTIDGKLTALDLQTGKVNWSRIIPGPDMLMDSFTASSRTSASSSDPRANSQTGVVIPSVDGYFYYHAPGLANLERAPMSAADLVNQSPVPGGDGQSEVSGSKVTHTYRIDKQTGDIVSVVNSRGKVDEYKAADTVDPENIMVLSRVQYYVHSSNRLGTQLWNASLTEFKSSFDEWSGTDGVRNKLPRLGATPDGRLICMAPSTNTHLWTEQFGFPVASVHLFTDVDALTGLPDATKSAAAPSTQDNQLVRVPVMYMDVDPTNSTKNLLADPSKVHVSRGPDGALFVLTNNKSPRRQPVLPSLPGPVSGAVADKEYGARKTEDWQKTMISLSLPVPVDMKVENGDVINLDSKEDASEDAQCFPGSSRYPDCMDERVCTLVDSKNPFLSSLQTPTAEPAAAQNSRPFTWKSLLVSTATSLIAMVIATILYRRNRSFKQSQREKPRVEEVEESPADASNKAVAASITSPVAEGQQLPLRLLNTSSSSSQLSQPSERSEAALSTASGGSASGQEVAVFAMAEDGLKVQLVNENLRIHVDRILGTGSKGTLVYDGWFAGRTVAVKRLVKHFYAGVENEISLLIASDQHPNVLRYYAKEEDSQFVYLALERCDCTLFDLLEHHPERNSDGLEFRAILDVEEKAVEKPVARLMSLAAYLSDTQHLRQLLHHIVGGVAHLHALNIVHRDIKPQNILVKTLDSGAGLHIKIADMGLGKKLDMHRSSFDSRVSGSVGWQPPEVVETKAGRLTKAVDVFSSGCVIFYMLTKGHHPFGPMLNREFNITKGAYSLDMLDKCLSAAAAVEAKDLIESMICSNPHRRVTAAEALNHPFFWSDEKKLDFLIAVSDRVEPTPPHGLLRVTLENMARDIIGDNWQSALHPELVNNLGQYRRYRFASLRDFLRVIRNKKNHYADLPPTLREELGSLPGGFLNYFTARFPKLLIYCYKVMAAFTFVETGPDEAGEPIIVDLANPGPHADNFACKFYGSVSLTRRLTLARAVRLAVRSWWPVDQWNAPVQLDPRKGETQGWRR